MPDGKLAAPGEYGVSASAWDLVGNRGSDAGTIVAPKAESLIAALLPNKLEVVLAVSVLAAVVIVGMLTAIGNERQRKAIEQLRDDVRNWALGDLEIKRETASRDRKSLGQPRSNRSHSFRWWLFVVLDSAAEPGHEAAKVAAEANQDRSATFRIPNGNPWPDEDGVLRTLRSYRGDLLRS